MDGAGRGTLAGRGIGALSVLLGRALALLGTAPTDNQFTVFDKLNCLIKSVLHTRREVFAIKDWPHTGLLQRSHGQIDALAAALWRIFCTFAAY